MTDAPESTGHDVTILSEYPDVTGDPEAEGRLREANEMYVKGGQVFQGEYPIYHPVGSRKADEIVPDVSGMTNREAMDAYEELGFCGSRRKRGGGRCTRPAGWGTEHNGQGRCKFHGGNALTTHKRYSLLDSEPIGQLYEEFADDPDPLNLLDELYMLRALAQDFIERHTEWQDALVLWWATVTQKKSNDPAVRAAVDLIMDESAPRQVMDVSDAWRAISEVTKVAKRIEDIRAQNAISRQDLFRVLREMGKIVRRHNDIEDPDERLRRIERDWESIKL